MPVYRKEIIKDNYVQVINPQIASFAGLEWGQRGSFAFSGGGNPNQAFIRIFGMQY